MRCWVAIFGLIALIIGYGADWSPYYVSLFFQGHSRVLGAIKQFEVPCKAISTNQAECSNRYELPQGLFRREESENWLGAGLIVSASGYRCDNSDSYAVTFDDPKNPGRLFDLLNRYQTVSVSGMACPGNILIDAWSRPGARRRGAIGGAVVVGSSAFVERVKRLSEFFTVDMVLLSGFLFLGLYALSVTLQQILRTEVQAHPFERSLWAWLSYIFVSGGLLQIVLPVTQLPQVTNRIAAILSLLCHADPLVSLISGQLGLQPRTTRRVRLGFGAVVLFSMLSPWFITLFAPEFFGAALLSLVLSFLKKDFLLAVYSFLFALTGLKLFGVFGLPHPQVTTYFVGLVVSFELASKFRQGAKLTRLLNSTRVDHVSSQLTSRLKELVKEAFEILGVGRLTVLSILPDGTCSLAINSNVNGGIVTQELHLDGLPPVFAHAISTGQAIWHMHADDKDLVNIRRGQSRGPWYLGNYLTVIPIFRDHLPVGAFAFTDYPDSWSRSSQKHNELKMVSGLLEPLLVDAIQFDVSSVANEWATVLEDVQLFIGGLVDIDFSELTEGVCTRLGAYGYIAELDAETRQLLIRGIFGYPSEVHERLTKGRLFALPENEQGPLALSVNRKLPVVVSNVKLWKNVLHENTNFFFDRAGTKSCAAVPILGRNGDVWGVLFLEKNTDDVFTAQISNGLTNIASKIGNAISIVEQGVSLEKTRRALSDFVPARVIESVISRDIHKEQDIGFLLMIDIRNSTKLSFEVGSDIWKTNIQQLAPKLEVLAAECGLNLQVIIWDAFYFTLSCAEPRVDRLTKIVEFVRSSVLEIEGWYQLNYGNFREFSAEESPKARFCVGYGDISLGFSEGKTRNWTIIGNEMAAISKLEDACKKIAGVLFADESLASCLQDGTWSSTDRQVPHTLRKIFVCSSDWSQLGTRDDISVSHYKSA